MKIAIVTPGGVDRSGTERVIPCLLWHVERLVQSGDDVHIFALRQETEAGHWALLGAQVHNAGGTYGIARGLRTLGQILEEHRRAPIDVIHALWAVPQGMLAAVACKMLDIPVLLHLPGGDLANLPAIGYGGRFTLKGRIGLRIAVLGADRVAAPSAIMVRDASELGIPAERMPFGVALDGWPVAPPRRRPESTPATLLHVADLSPVKDQETLLMAAFHLRAREIPFVLQIVGKDGLHGAIQRRADQLGLGDCVHFTGFLPQDALKQCMVSADLLIVTSMHEAGPIVAREAAAAGVPTVGTNVGLLAEWAPMAARVIKCGDSMALADEIAGLLSHEDERLLLAARAQEKTIAEDADATTSRIRGVYAELVSKREARTRRRALNREVRS
ncbi:MAG TPA: glycosyltransferase family 4 protein [Rhizomicrobium sp.]|jgi:glycosyltransferase involved in cell wall biosynthesis